MLVCCMNGVHYISSVVGDCPKMDLQKQISSMYNPVGNFNSPKPQEEDSIIQGLGPIFGEGKQLFATASGNKLLPT